MNHGFTYREQLDGRADGVSLLDYLQRHYQHSSFDEWRARLAAGLLTLDGEVASSAASLRAGQALCWHRPGWVEAAVPLFYELVHEDEQLLVVNKPSGLPTMPAGGFLEHTLLALVRQRDLTWSPVHRLGRGTSGLVVFCRSGKAHATLQSRWGEVDKRYLALATGTVVPQRIEQPIGQVYSPKLGQLWAASASGRKAASIVEAVEPHGEHSMATVKLVTGRPHQIRIHLAAIGHPLVNDPLYLAGGGITDALPGDTGYFLHAWKVGLLHPVTGRREEWQAKRLEEPPAAGAHLPTPA